MVKKRVKGKVRPILKLLDRFKVAKQAAEA